MGGRLGIFLAVPLEKIGDWRLYRTRFPWDSEYYLHTLMISPIGLSVLQALAPIEMLEIFLYPMCFRYWELLAWQYLRC